MLEIAQQQLLAPAGLELHHLDKVLDHLLSHQVDLADVYFQSSRLEAWTLEDGIVKEGSYNIEQGAGIRAISGEKTGFAYTDELFLPNLIEAADTARAIARSGQRGTVAIESRTARHQLYQPINPLDSLTREEKISLLHDVEQEARHQDERVRQVIVSLVGAQDIVQEAFLRLIQQARRDRPIDERHGAGEVEVALRRVDHLQHQQLVAAGDQPGRHMPSEETGPAE